ncbi:MAG: Hypothetical protein BHV28_04300 [Candidatus Tokpelaia hoelldobleri]|uniref:Uncharacterized protein n=1 Tax=Candidatus Tokpelaia hoelldobleri TaxID=1902579 RepID=A0A1U9JTG2_9HYPH|nr:MAG: Hypothetical protein BHV28_04300 [Candidatus Tokpelaia hoelldoblerii]
MVGHIAIAHPPRIRQAVDICAAVFSMIFLFWQALAYFMLSLHPEYFITLNGKEEYPCLST